jgi:hypothetical protein
VTVHTLRDIATETERTFPRAKRSRKSNPEDLRIMCPIRNIKMKQKQEGACAVPEVNLACLMI